MSFSQCDRQEHPWEDLEEAFEIVAYGPKYPPDTLINAYRQIDERSRADAYRRLSRCGIPNAANRADEFAQNFLIELHDAVLPRCDPDKPIYPFAYFVFGRKLNKSAKAALKQQPASIDFDVEDRKSLSWLEEEVQSEERGDLERAVETLREDLREVIEKRIAWVETGIPPALGSKADRRDFARLLYQARRQLKELLGPNHPYFSAKKKRRTR